MKRFKNVKRLLWVSLMCIPPSFGQTRIPSVPRPPLDCGNYQIQGIVRKNSSGDFILSVHSETKSPFELLLIGGGLFARESHLGNHVIADVYVPQTIHDDRLPFVYLQEFLTTRKIESTDFVDKIQSLSCGQRSKFKPDKG